ncbi:uncharacterized protein PF3D7_1120000-like [Polyergus mexicanus]|uniref:uncharacterized protein PF3D7_1120000-like n=1 Tax=Polyergus mexicanus TaxID=615972 RepID=UPI0038B65EDA
MIDPSPVTQSKGEHVVDQNTLRGCRSYSRTLTAEINRIQESIDLTQGKIIEKAVDLLELDIVAEAALCSLVPSENLGGDWENDRAGRARRCGETSRPRGRSPRTTNHETATNMNMDTDKVKKLPPQGFRSPNDRRASSMVPEACSSSSFAGLSSTSAMGVESEIDTAEEGHRIEDNRDLLDLTFVNYSSSSPGGTETQRMKTDSGDLRMTPKQDEERELAGKIKRKAKASPDVITPSDEDIGKESFPRNTPVALRKTRPKKKRTQAAITKESVEDPSSVRSSDTERSSGTNSMKQKKISGEIFKPKPGESGKLTTSKGRKKEDSIIISSEDEETGKDFAPQDLRIMGAINVGSLGLDCLANVIRMRSRSKNLQGGINGKMRRDLERAREIINTLIYKAESTGDSTFLKMKNKELSAEIVMMKLNEVLRKREMDEIKGQFDELRNEIAELKRRLEEAEDRRDEAEEDRKKARESFRITDWKWRNKGYKLGEEGVRQEMMDKGTLTKEEITQHLPSKEDTRGEDPMMNLRNHEAENLQAVMESEPEKRKKEIITEGSINKQIKDLIKKRAELKKKGKVEDSETGGEPGKTEDGAYSLLPQRVPKVRPRIISNIRLIPPSSAERRTEDTRDNNTQIRDNSGNRSESREAWVNVNRRGKGSERRKEQVRGDLPAHQNPGYTANREPENNNVRTGKTIGLKRKPPKNAAVMITSYKKELTYAEVIKRLGKKSP